MSRASARRRPLRDRSQIRPSHRKAVSPVEQFGRAQTVPFPRVRAQIGALVCGRAPVV